jgi:hypothetical protein
MHDSLTLTMNQRLQIYENNRETKKSWPAVNDWVIKKNVMDVRLDVMDDLAVDVNDLDDYTLHGQAD